jgi:Gpi18-like mannosyltransferase
MLLTAFLLRVSVIALAPNHSDLEIFRKWGVKTNIYGVTSTYESIRHYTASNYPPISTYLMWGFDQAGNLLKKGLPGADGFALMYLLFLAFIDCLIGLTIYLKLKSAGKSFLGALFFLFNPGVLYCSMVWGQLDNLYTLFLLISLVLLLDKRVGAAGILYGLACLTKVQAAVFCPLFLFIVLRRYSLRALLPFLVSFILVFLAGSLPFILTRRFQSVITCFLQSDSLYPYLSLNAFNLWWLLSVGKGFTPDDVRILFNITAKSTGLILFATAYIAVLLIVRQHEGRAKSSQDNAGVVLSFALLAFAFFLLPTQMHERYLFPFFVFLPLLPLSSHFEKWLYAVITLSYFINLNAVFHLHRQLSGFWTQHIDGIGMICAVLNLSAFLILALMSFRRR